MKLKDLTVEQIDAMSKMDISELILKEEGALSTSNLFKKVCDFLELGDSYFENEISDYYTKLVTDKRFVIIEEKWDLRDNNEIKKDEDYDEEDDDLDFLEEEIEVPEEEEEDDEEDSDYDEKEEEDEFLEELASKKENYIEEEE